eukprot:m.95301 g.95301  ORF g.95301 m.95301 type:complete len:1139 (+) comp15148_c1_seq2:206-3622(+)
MFANKRPAGTMLSPYRAGAPRSSLAHTTPRASRLQPVAPREQTRSRQTLKDTERLRLEVIERLPIPIKEALSRRSGMHACTSRIDEYSGLRWLVVSARHGGSPSLFVWTEEFCQELHINDPQLVSADTICPVVLSTHQRQGMLVATSAGRVVYWPNVTHAGSIALDIDFDRAEDSTVALVSLEPAGYVLGTRMGQLFLINVQNPSGRAALSFSRIRRQTGGALQSLSSWSAGLFGFGSSGQPDEAPIKAIKASPRQLGPRQLYVLTETSLLSWNISDSSRQEVLEELQLVDDMGTAVGELQDAIADWDPNIVDVRTLDVCVSTDMSVTVLVAAVSSSGQVAFFLGDMFGGDDGPMWRRQDGPPLQSVERAVDVELLVPDGITAYLVFRSEGVVLPTRVGEEERDLFSEQMGQADLLGCNAVDGEAFFVLASHGGVVVQFIQKDIDRQKKVATQVETMEQTMAAAEVTQQTASSKEKQYGWLVAAFEKYCEFCNTPEQQVDIANDLLGTCTTFIEQAFGGLNSHGLDQAVLSLSEEVLDSAPASDPRWAEDASSVAEESSLIILEQLKAKMKRHENLFRMLGSVHTGDNICLWNKLSVVPFEGASVATQSVLCERGELLAVAIKLRELHTAWPGNLVDEAVAQVLHHRGLSVQFDPHTRLGPHDLFYRQVSRVFEIFPALVYEEEKVFASRHGPDHQEARVEILRAANRLFEQLFQEVFAFREGHRLLYTPLSREDGSPAAEFYVGFTFSDSVRNAVVEQCKATFHKAIEGGTPHATHMFQQLRVLADCLLSGFEEQRSALRNENATEKERLVTESFVEVRQALIQPFVDEPSQRANAVYLAETYKDFAALVILCQNEPERLDHYTLHFGKEFSDFLYDWYWDRGERAKLLAQPAKHNMELGNFLESHDSLRWLHEIRTDEFSKAHQTLLKLAQRENHLYEKRKALFSLSKLALVAANDESHHEETWTEMNRELDLLEFQAALPSATQQAFFKGQTQRPLSAEELVDLLVPDAHAGDARLRLLADDHVLQALELLELYVSQEVSAEEAQTRRAAVLATAVVAEAETWVQLPGGEPLDQIQSLLLTRALSTAHGKGLPIHVTPADVLASSRLGSNSALKEAPHLAHHLRLAFELAAAPPS